MLLLLLMGIIARRKFMYMKLSRITYVLTLSLICIIATVVMYHIVEMFDRVNFGESSIVFHTKTIQFY